ncbi:hypothetical protein BDV95DRAFT_488778 [Massariosphaeria phaeospora]|uniref:OTU domain-containing protein n=1 Tax=Massariosphaeria phaeospora TaxID=100035 RepID=A0A7C8MA73_9PLEO|nr:hypothetical protein BDV95DRAFT_488778 [Massariosphaeria phaeospora]
MAPRKSRASSPEFPILDANGLYAKDTRGDGNCLFNALSDQLYGHQDMHEMLRATTIVHMRDNADFYRQYMAMNSVRRNPKRKTTAIATTRIDTTYYSEDELQKQFDDHVEKMGQPGEWADNMEVSAFASALNVHVRLWQADYTYLFSPRVYYAEGSPEELPTIHIAYHGWEHYSSVRNLTGPHSGLPSVNVFPETPSRKRPSPSIDDDDEEPIRRACKRRSPLPLFDSDSTPECTESSSDESNGPIPSQSSQLDVPSSQEQVPRPHKLTIKLRGLRTTDPVENAKSSFAAGEPMTAIPYSQPTIIDLTDCDTITTEDLKATNTETTKLDAESADTEPAITKVQHAASELATAEPEKESASAEPPATTPTTTQPDGISPSTNTMTTTTKITT